MAKTWKIERFGEPDRSDWEGLVNHSINGSFLNTRKFLDYHGDRFVDHSLVIRDSKRGDVIAIIPAVETEEMLCSHPGATYGGLIVARQLRVVEVLDLFEAVRLYLMDARIKRFQYNPPPRVFHQEPFEADLYALWRHGARIVRQLPNFVINDSSTPLGRRRQLAIAEATGVAVARSGDVSASFELIANQLEKRHAARAVHSLPEFLDLVQRFPDHIRVIDAIHCEELCGSVVVFRVGRALHTQYLGTTELGRRIRAMDAIIAEIYRWAAMEAAPISFGIATDQNGLELNEGLARFKQEFGSSLSLISRYEWSL